MSTLLHLKHIELWKAGSKEKQEFTPRVPNKTAMGEDHTIPRICTSTTIESCVKASPRTSYVLFGMLDDINLMEMTYEYFQWFLETAQSGMLVRVYHFEVDESIVKLPNEIHQSGLVPDALLTDEHWIMEKVKPVKTTFAIVERDEDEKCKLQIVQESELLEELGVFVNGELVHEYLFKHRFNEMAIDLKQQMTYKEALSFKNSIEEDFEKK